MKYNGLVVDGKFLYIFNHIHRCDNGDVLVYYRELIYKTVLDMNLNTEYDQFVESRGYTLSVAEVKFVVESNFWGYKKFPVFRSNQ